MDQSLVIIIEGPSGSGAEVAHRLMAANLGPCNTKGTNVRMSVNVFTGKEMKSSVCSQIGTQYLLSLICSR